MSKLIYSIEELFCGIFKDVGSSFAGVYVSKNEDVTIMTKEMFDEEIPSAHQDRINLRNDGINVVSDYKRAYELKKKELHEI